MASLDVKFSQLLDGAQSFYWHNRIVHEVGYGIRLSKVKGGTHDSLLHRVCDFLLQVKAEHGVILQVDAKQAEAMLESLSSEAKSFTIICAAHAHIDMNWKWSFDETVAVTIDTFRTILDLLRDYPRLTFSQSQASTYWIVEQFAPEMLEEIREFVREGRWEVTASTWVEPDKNMPNGESLSRHLLYTRRYLTNLLGVEADYLNIDFEPDTFGHSLHVPEILTHGGVRYYYHCRGYDGHNIYRWVGPSGASVLVYREPIWYNAEITPDMAFYVPEFCASHGLDAMLKVYGVGDHGGGPTRRDIERLLDMGSWPVFPQIRFGTFHEWFALLNQNASNFPEVHGELNFVFTGCYTTQTRIKKANRVSEATLQEAELFDAMSHALGGGPYSSTASDSTTAYEAAWRDVLFNQFHDIIPGSGVTETREHAMGLFQNTMAVANTRRSLAMKYLAALRHDANQVSPQVEEEKWMASTSEGAGVGFGASEFRVSQAERGRGMTRTYHLFNAAPFECEEVAEITVWDWVGDVERMQFTDLRGKTLTHQVLDENGMKYWGHSYIRVLVKARVPACGYTTIRLAETDASCTVLRFPKDPRVERPRPYILENQLIRATLHTETGRLISLVDKTTGMELIHAERGGAGFRFIREDDSRGMTAWIVGRYMSVLPLGENARIRWLDSPEGNPVRQAIEVKLTFAASELTSIISLDDGSPTLCFDVSCEWREIGRKGAGVPQLGFSVPLSYRSTSYKYDVPFGVIGRPGLDMDVPANSFAVGVRSPEPAAVLLANADVGTTGQSPIVTNTLRVGPSLMLATDSKYGFRGVDDALAVTLIRSSFDPDAYPEVGHHSFKLALSLVDGGKSVAHAEGRAAGSGSQDLLYRVFRMNHPIQVVTTGAMSSDERGLLKLETGTVAISAIKLAEDTDEKNRKPLIVRLYETDGEQSRVRIRFCKPVEYASFVDVHEQPFDAKSDGAGLGRDGDEIELSGHSAGSRAVTAHRDLLTFTVAPHQVVSIRIVLE